MLLEKFTVNSDGTITVKGGVSGYLEDGKYSQKAENIEGKKRLRLSLKKKNIIFRVIGFQDDSEGQIQMQCELEEDKVWGMILIPKQ